jgi:hypothetical protein
MAFVVAPIADGLKAIETAFGVRTEEVERGRALERRARALVPAA